MVTFFRDILFGEAKGNCYLHKYSCNSEEKTGIFHVQDILEKDEPSTLSGKLYNLSGKIEDGDAHFELSDFLGHERVPEDQIKKIFKKPSSSKYLSNQEKIAKIKQELRANQKTGSDEGLFGKKRTYPGSYTDSEKTAIECLLKHVH